MNYMKFELKKVYNLTITHFGLRLKIKGTKNYYSDQKEQKLTILSFYI